MRVPWAGWEEVWEKVWVQVRAQQYSWEGGGDEARVRVWARQNFLEKASGFKVHVTFGFGLSRTAVGAGMFRLAFGLRFRSAALYGMTLAPDPLMSTIVPY